ncbi:hypothetical protein [Pseudomonas phage Astolliot]|nr:hypothetical protein [Pseudomonas phage Astolliot]
MSRTIRRGKRTRNFHKYIGIGLIWGENRRTHISVSYPGGRYNDISDEPLWKDREYESYEDYVAYEIRKYHMDRKHWSKTPSWCFRVEVQKQKRAHKAALHYALATGREDELILVRNGQDAEWMWW